MRSLLSACCALALSLLSSVALAVAPDRWDTVIQNSAVHTIDLWRGESLDLRPRFFSYTTPWAISTGATVTLYWSTNNFASAPWGTNGTVVATETGRVSAIWTPSCDAGAATYQYFVGVSETSGLLYRARGTIRMHTSPGYQPSTAPLPVWDGWTNNFVYAPLAGLQAVSNAAATALQGHVVAVDPHGDQAFATSGDIAALAVARSFMGATSAADRVYADNVAETARTGSIATAASMLATGKAARATSADRVLQLDSAAWVSVVNGTATLWRVAADTNALVVTDSSLGTYGHVPAVGSVFRRATSTTFTNACSDGVWSIALQTGTWWMWSPQPIGAMGGDPEGYYHAGFGDYYVTVAYAPNALTNAYPLARLEDFPSLAPYATTESLTAVSNLVVQAGLAAAAAATNSIDITARAGLTTRPTFAQATNIVAQYAAPSFPIYDYGTHSNVTFVLSNNVLYLYGN